MKTKQNQEFWSKIAYQLHTPVHQIIRSTPTGPGGIQAIKNYWTYPVQSSTGFRSWTGPFQTSPVSVTKKCWLKSRITEKLPRNFNKIHMLVNETFYNFTTKRASDHSFAIANCLANLCHKLQYPSLLSQNTDVRRT